MKKYMIAMTFGALCAMFLTACSNSGTAVASGASGSGTLKIESTDTPTITVSAKESVSVVPDMAEVVLGVTTQNADAKACQEENTKTINGLTEKLKELGIAETSIQTSDYNMNVRQDWQNNGEVIGYEMTAMLTVSDIPLDQVGTILTETVQAGANEVRSVVYMSSKYDESYQEALQMAAASAEEKARALAAASGSTLGHAIRINEYSANQQARYAAPEARAMAGAGAGAADMSVNMMPGELEIEASISVDYAIMPGAAE